MNTGGKGIDYYACAYVWMLSWEAALGLLVVRLVGNTLHTCKE